MTDLSTRVLVVGAGPTGATLTAFLAAHGIDVICVEREEGPERHSKAGNLWPRTLEMLGMIPGATDRILSRSHVLRRLEVWGFGSLTARVPSDRYDSPYPAAVHNGQDVIEAALWALAAEHDRPVRAGHRFVSAKQDEHGVTAQVEGPGGPLAIRADWLVGCGGASSQVRNSAGLDFEPKPQEGVRILLMDAALRWARPTRSDRMWMFFHDDGYLGINPVWGAHHHVWRFEKASSESAGDPSREDMEAALRRHSGDPTARLAEPVWSSHIDAPRTGVAPALRAGRMLLAGDAGHVALPIGGQGMNSGIQDALALGWRLEAVLAGRAKEALLDSYAEERHRVRSKLRDDQVAQVGRLVDPGWRDKLGMKVLGPLLAKVTGAAEFGGGRDAAMLALSYPGGRAVRDDLGGLAPGGAGPGQRAPEVLLGGGDGDEVSLHARFYAGDWTLLTLAGEAPDWGPLPSWIAPLYVTAEPARAPGTAYDLAGDAAEAYGIDRSVLVRPDGYIGWRGRPGDRGALDAYLDEAGMGARVA